VIICLAHPSAKGGFVKLAAENGLRDAAEKISGLISKKPLAHGNHGLLTS
jgi:hypothetical protein